MPTKYVIGYLHAYMAAETVYKERLRSVEGAFVRSMSIINANMGSADYAAKVETTRRAERGRIMGIANSDQTYGNDQREIRDTVAATIGKFGEILAQRLFDTEEAAKDAIATAKFSDDRIRRAFTIEQHRVSQ